MQKPWKYVMTIKKYHFRNPDETGQWCNEKKDSEVFTRYFEHLFPKNTPTTVEDLNMWPKPFSQASQNSFNSALTREYTQWRFDI